MDYRTDLAMERTVYPGGIGEGVAVQLDEEAAFGIQLGTEVIKEDFDGIAAQTGACKAGSCIGDCQRCKVCRRSGNC